MSWEKFTLTTADNVQRIAFNGRGSIYVEGTFGGGTVQVKPVTINPSTNVKEVSTGFLDDAIDGTTIKSKDVPSGLYAIELNGSTGASVDVYVNNQVEEVVA